MDPFKSEDQRGKGMKDISMPSLCQWLPQQARLGSAYIWSAHGSSLPHVTTGEEKPHFVKDDQHRNAVACLCRLHLPMPVHHCEEEQLKGADKSSSVPSERQPQATQLVRLLQMR
jgi:hypothetical protein